MRRHLLLVAPLLLGPLLTHPTSAAGAQEGSRQGWWTAAGVGGLLPGSAVGPDVPSDGLLVQGGLRDDAPVAIAALAVPVDAGADVRTITISAVATGANLPGSVLLACPLAAPDFAAAQGGPIAEAPAHDCTGAEAATAGADGVSYTFDARPLVAGDAVALAIAPGSPATRVALTGAAGATVRSAAPRPATPPSTTPPTAGPRPVVAPATGATGGGAPIGRPAAVPVAPAAGLVAPAPVVAPGATAVAPTPFRPAGFGVAVPPAANRLAILVLVAALGAASYAWTRAGRLASVR
jgi:hypothetical protein